MIDLAATGSDMAEGVGPGGGTLSTLSFAILGDTRPPTLDDTAGYPTAVITRIWQDIQAASPRPAFAVDTGGYMFASPSHTPSQAQPQLATFAAARSAFSGVLFPAMGSEECDGATVDNCDACGTACNAVGGTCVNGTCQTPNLAAFVSTLLGPIGESLPYYTIHINDTRGAWTAKFVFVACNAWSTTQATWLDGELSAPTTYTFVVRNEDSVANTAPCLSGTGANNADAILAQHPYTLLIAGHTHTYSYYAAQKEVVVGNGGAPLSGTVNYGYVIARQQANGTMTFTEYDYSTNAVGSTFTVAP
jgi:hypothetical protein